MTDSAGAGKDPDTKQRLLEAAARLVAASPGQEVPLRAICDAAGVKLPTLYHFFGSKQGLLEAVIDHGFELYLGVKDGLEPGADPLEDIRRGWDAHVEFGVANPAFYALMYGQVVPGSRPEAQGRATGMLRKLTGRAEAQGRLAVSAERAADLILAANVGVTLHCIVEEDYDDALSAELREACLEAITGSRAPAAVTPSAVGESASSLLLALDDGEARLSSEEAALLRVWLRRLTD
ncbi:TetR/AcrR family transcriptional regulator [Arthrobacter sp. NPDC090010]|uniref:TetR/AcrR family transcriptional regulator n=1 Tax=Arthrobacter sp. NPDC090010 TaxID=3363942 RepID=UPI0038069AC7